MEFPYTGRRLTGVLVPLSALRSKSSYGVGEIPDLIELARWAKQCGLELIQILPINDTGGQSSPYSALSAFALHPIYLRIQDLPEYQGAPEEVRGELNRRIDRLRKQYETPGADGYKRSTLAYRELYEEKLELLTLLFDTSPEEALSSEEIEQWTKKNPWVEPYAVYRTLKQSTDNRSWTDWEALRNPDSETIERFWNAPDNRRSTRFWAWLQLRLEQQMQSVATEADNLGIALKGDLPILMNEESVDIWANREIFIQELRAGAPPDMFSYLGQNWDFPIYNWEEMHRREYSWWKERLQQAQKFYHAFRIDHVLGFFRIWAIPETHFSGLPGYFYPSEQMSREELHAIGFDDGRIRWLAEPHLEGFRIRELVGEEKQTLKGELFRRLDGEDLYLFSEKVTGERAITELAFQYSLSEEQTSSLLTEYRNRALIPTVDNKLAATWNYRECDRFQTLTKEERDAFEQLLSEKQERSEKLWEAQGMELLSMMREEVDMLPCAEDLGVVPPSVPRTLKKLDILGLTIPRWNRLWDQPGQPFVHPRDYTELSVCAPSVHDTSTMRVWWEQEEGGPDFWDALELEGEPSEHFEPATARTIYRAFQQGSPRICVYQIQDFFALAPELLDPEPKRERVNVPGTYNDVNWSWRMPIDIEDLITMKNLTEELQDLVTYRDPGLRGEKREFHVSRAARERYEFDEELFSSRGFVVFPNTHGAQRFAHRINKKREEAAGEYAQAGDLYAMGLIDEVFHYLVGLYRDQYGDGIFDELMNHLRERFGERELEKTLERFATDFPTTAVYRKERTAREQLDADVDAVPGRQIALEELIMLWLANLNPAFSPYADLFSDAALRRETKYGDVALEVEKYFAEQPGFGPNDQSLVELLREPAIEHPDSLQAQLEFVRKKWGSLLGAFFARLLRGIDLIKEERIQRGGPGGPGPTEVLRFGAAAGAGEELEAERFSPDREWMPKVVLLAKSTLVWLSQLTDQYKRPIRRLDEIPDETLDQIARRGFNSLWLIGLWERSSASRRIKQLTGNPEAAASAYALYDYEIASELGGWEALENLRRRCMRRGIRLASDMVPNHTGIDSRWIHEHPDWYVQTDYSPYPTYSFTGENLSTREGIGIYLEDHYYDRTDAAVAFKRVDEGSGRERYIYHGNDGTSMPWNDTAQLDFLNPEVREAVVQLILHVARNFPVIRFDAAMTLAKKHIQRLWYPQPGAGGAIPSRSDHAITQEEFDSRIPKEFWREVVDRVAEEIPDTLLLAEAFWMMEGYFVRTLGMHRVYNSAFMNMLKNEENAKYRQTIKNTLEFDPEILKRFVNFMNNPDEDTAVAQFGKEDKYFGVCTLMVTMPGLPMFGHGQVEGFEEKYGMEYTRAYKQETPDLALEARHNREIFPLLHKRYVFADSENFRLYDLFAESGEVNENVFAYTNGAGNERAFVLYNNFWEETWGWIKGSAGYIVKEDGAKVRRSTTLAEALGLHRDYHHYCIMREQRTGLWFIRNSGELHEQGMFVHLGGYQTQVFTDIYEAADNEYAHYAQLADSLGGAGTPDINRALIEVSLKPLHDAFARPLNSGTARVIVHEFLRRGEAMDFRLLAEEYRSFLAIAREFTDRTTDVERGITEFTSLTNGLARMRQLATLYERQSADKAGSKAARLSAEKTRDQTINGETTSGATATSGARKKGATVRSDRLSAKENKELEEAIAVMASHLTERSGIGDISVLGAVLFLLPVNSLIEETMQTAKGTKRPPVEKGYEGLELVRQWLLTDRAAEIFRHINQEQSLPGVWRPLVELLLIHFNWQEYAPKSRLPEALTSLFDDETALQFLGVNLHEGVRWFNKEMFEELIEWFFLVGTWHACTNHREPEEKILEVYRAYKEWKTAEPLSNYQVERLLTELENKVK